MWICLKVTYATSLSSVTCRQTRVAARKIKLCAVRGELGRDFGRGLERGQFVSKHGDIVRKSSASNEAGETDQVERLASVGGDGGFGDGTGDNGGSGDGSEGGGDGHKPLNPAAGLWSRFAFIHISSWI